MRRNSKSTGSLKSTNGPKSASSFENRIKLPIKQPYLAIWSLLYFSFLLLGLVMPNSPIVTSLKLAGIVLCLVYAVIYSENTLLKFAFVFTVLADISLALDSAAISGVITFCLAQFTHFMRLKKNVASFSPIVFYAGILLIFLLSVFLQIDAHYPLATVYCATLVANILLAKKHSQLSFLGFLLFLCCDILVAVSYLASVGILHSVLRPIADYLCWIFYLPSQVLIATAPDRCKKVAKTR